MKKILIERMVLEVGEVIDLHGVKPVSTNQGKNKFPILEKASRALVYRVKECNGLKRGQEYSLYYTITNTGHQVQLNDSEVGDCMVINGMSIADFFADDGGNEA